ncbi:MAG: DNA topoisomerase [Methanobacteriota archaeon]
MPDEPDPTAFAPAAKPSEPKRARPRASRSEARPTTAKASPSSGGASYLIICEKNDAAKQIAKALSGGRAKMRRDGGVPIYRFDWDGATANVVGLRGHIVELDFEKGHNRWSLEPTKLHALVDAAVEKSVTEAAIVKALKAEAKDASIVIVATDYDREGELIGVEALDALGSTIKGKPVKRAKYSSFTAKEVKEAFAHLQEVDYKLAQAGEARQVIDLAWGAALTRYLSVAASRRGRGFLSVGRVQTPTLGLIVDREKERLAFVPQAYWEVDVDLDAPPTFTASHDKSGYKTTRVVPDAEDGEGEGREFSLEGKFQSEAEAAQAAAAIRRAGSATVVSIEGRERLIRAPQPFSTTVFQAECASRLGLGVKRAMDIAQRLYLAGFISYHRTENTVYPPTLDLNELVGMLSHGPLREAASWTAKHRREAPTRGKKETTDHPPIYPTAVPGPDVKLQEMERRVWELVARRFLATLSPDAKLAQTTARFEAGGEPLRTTGQTTVFAGWRHVYPYAAPDERPLPDLREGQRLVVKDVRQQGKQTEPPKRYGQGSLIAKMEELGIGTKATRHEIIQKLIDRNYITESPVAPTTVGFAVTAALEEHARTITEPGMTHRLEDEMDQIEKGERTLEETLADSRSLLHGVVDTLLAHKDAIGAEVKKALDEDANAGVCPSCENQLLVRANRFGGQFIGCRGYPECTVTYNLPARGRITFRDPPCETCKAPYVLHEERGRKQEFCANGECPTRAEAAEAEKLSLGTCPTCNHGTLQMLRSRNFKRYVRCDNPDCMAGERGAQTYPLPQRGEIVYEGVRCETCGAPRVKVITKGRSPWDICVNMGCPSKEKKAAPSTKGQG